MDKLLNWSLAQQDPATADKVGAPDPKLLAQLFGQQVDEPTLMKQNLQLIQNDEAEKEQKLISFDNFEMLIENLDNANNIENLKLWPEIINLLDLDDSEFQNLTLSIIGTSVQNNEKCQKDFLKHDGMGKIIKLGEVDETRHKSLYALSNILRNNQDSYKPFEENNGWGLITSISDLDSKTILRSLSLLNSIQTISPLDQLTHNLKKNQIITNILQEQTLTDINIVDKILHTLVGLINQGYEFDDNEKSQIQKATKFIETQFGDVVNHDDLQIIKQV